MATALPARNILDGTALPVTSQMKTALGSLRDYLSEQLGASGGTSVARLTDFASVTAASGYQKLPSGLIIQWGTASGFTGSPFAAVNITLPIAFTTALYSVIASSQGGGISCATGGGLTSISVTNSTAGASFAFWIAIGK